MLLMTFDAWSTFRAKAIALVNPDVYYVEGEGFFQCGVVTPNGVGLRFSGESKPTGLTGFGTSFPTATLADGMGW